MTATTEEERPIRRGARLPLTRKRRVIAIAGIAYVVTWIGGWMAHAAELERRAERFWNAASTRNVRMAAEAAAEGWTYDSTGLREGGPSTRVHWCLPIAPGLLLARSEYVVGPLAGRGGVKLVLYYGLGSRELGMIAGWVS